MRRGPYGVGQGKEPDKEVMRKQRQHKRTTRPKTRRRPKLFTEPIRSNNDKKTTQNNTRYTNNNTDRQAPGLRENKRTMKIRGTFFPYFKREESPSGGHREGRLWDQPGAKRSYKRSHEVEIDKRQEERRRAKNE